MFRIETTDGRTIIAPLPHLNGTSPETLLADYREVLSALRAARAQMESYGPHSRDYYPSGPAAWEQARMEHEYRLAALARMIRDYEALALFVSEAATPESR